MPMPITSGLATLRYRLLPGTPRGLIQSIDEGRLLFPKAKFGVMGAGPHQFPLSAVGASRGHDARIAEVARRAPAKIGASESQAARADARLILGGLLPRAGEVLCGFWMISSVPLC